MNKLKMFEEFNFFKKKKVEQPTIKTSRDDWFDFRSKIDKEAELAGYDDVEEYLDFLVHSGQISDMERIYYQIG